MNRLTDAALLPEGDAVVKTSASGLWQLVSATPDRMAVVAASRETIHLPHPCGAVASSAHMV